MHGGQKDAWGKFGADPDEDCCCGEDGEPCVTSCRRRLLVTTSGDYNGIEPWRYAAYR